MAESKSQSKKAEAEERHAQEVASATGPTPAPAAEEAEPTKEEQKATEAASEVATTLEDLDRDTLVRLQTAVDHAVRQKGTDVATAGPTLEEVSGTLPVNDEETEALTFAKAAKAVGAEEEEILDAKVRQARAASGKAFGPAYIRVVKTDGSKAAVAA